MNATDRHLNHILDWCRRYRSGELDGWGLHLNLRAASTALEGDVPLPVRQAVSRTETEIDGLYFTIGDDREAIERVLRELETAIQRYK